MRGQRVVVDFSKRFSFSSAALDDAVNYLKKHAKNEVTGKTRDGIRSIIKHGRILDERTAQATRHDADEVIDKTIQRIKALRLSIIDIRTVLPETLLKAALIHGKVEQVSGEEDYHERLSETVAKYTGVDSVLTNLETWCKLIQSEGLGWQEETKDQKAEKSGAKAMLHGLARIWLRETGVEPTPDALPREFVEWCGLVFKACHGEIRTPAAGNLRGLIHKHLKPREIVILPPRRRARVRYKALAFRLRTRRIKFVSARRRIRRRVRRAILVRGRGKGESISSTFLL